jgi:hypothetical protein
VGAGVLMVVVFPWLAVVVTWLAVLVTVATLVLVAVLWRTRRSHAPKREMGDDERVVREVQQVGHGHSSFLIVWRPRVGAVLHICRRSRKRRCSGGDGAGQPGGVKGLPEAGREVAAGPTPRVAAGMVATTVAGARRRPGGVRNRSNLLDALDTVVRSQDAKAPRPPPP